VTLRNRLRCARWVGLSSVIPVIILLHRLGPVSPYRTPLILLIVVAFFLYLFGVSIWLMARAQRRMGRLNEAQDYEGARRLIEELRAMYPDSPASARMFQPVEGTQLCLEGRHPEAVLSTIDPAQLRAASRPTYLNNLAWSLALSGNAADAVLRARESLVASEAAGKAAKLSRANQIGTLGTALVLAGEAAEGVSRLEEALFLGGKPDAQATRAFFLGEGMRALGRYDDAAKAFRRAVEEAPSSDFGQRAQVSLQGLAAYRS
jgi:tetratricopeptide (TPR) repeat protein